MKQRELEIKNQIRLIQAEIESKQKEIYELTKKLFELKNESKM